MIKCYASVLILSMVLVVVVEQDVSDFKFSLCNIEIFIK